MRGPIKNYSKSTVTQLLFARTKKLQYHYLPCYLKGVQMYGSWWPYMRSIKQQLYLLISQNVCIFYCNVNAQVKATWENSSMHLPRGIYEFGKLQIFGSGMARKESGSPITILAPFEPEGSFSLLLWYLKLSAVARGPQAPRSTAKSHSWHLLKLPKPKVAAPTWFPSHLRATACGFSHR